jgi:hypothetical protein
MTRAQRAHQKKAFLDVFRRTANISAAAQTAGVSRSAVYKWRARDRAFAAAFAEGEVESLECLELEAYKRAVLGVEKPVYQGGARVGAATEYSDTLLIFLLKARAPEKYAQRASVDVRAQLAATVDVTLTDARTALQANLVPHDLDHIARRLLDSVGDSAGDPGG